MRLSLAKSADNCVYFIVRLSEPLPASLTCELSLAVLRARLRVCTPSGLVHIRSAWPAQSPLNWASGTAEATGCEAWRFVFLPTLSDSLMAVMQMQTPLLEIESTQEESQAGADSVVYFQPINAAEGDWRRKLFMTTSPVFTADCRPPDRRGCCYPVKTVQPGTHTTGTTNRAPQVPVSPSDEPHSCRSRDDGLRFLNVTARPDWPS
ncbi:unnamed protein product [Protopolystoma xenopodis]|uniref:Uncharacterized protein n=1 Tax=Protopolystoma xenopodis TaxID=117903 RepID=A0A448WAZ3_9PLAT|nr:unnamed protein product [Protopolystoma xenopodis]